MRVQSSLLLVVLLALETQWHVALCRKKGEDFQLVCETSTRKLVRSTPGQSIPELFRDRVDSSNRDKLGGCPPDDGPCGQVVPDQCTNDRQCPSSWKCCPRACFRQCIPRVFVKPGKCPVDRLRCLSPPKHTCNKDLDCSGTKRCCVSACGRDCRDPSKG